MTIKPQTHSLNSIEVTEIKSLGFLFQGISAFQDEFINTHFANCDLLLFLNQIDDILSPVCNSSINKYIYLNNSPLPELLIQYFTNNYEDENNGLALSRIFFWQDGELVVKHDYFRLPASSRNKGIAKKIFQASLQQYINMGVRKILVHAALNDGGYVWARNYFSAINQDETRQILDDAKSKLTPVHFWAVERIYNNYYEKNPSGIAFPIVKWAELPFMKDILRGSNWHGVIDLQDREQFTNFILYVFK